ncbi:hypothetical protein SODALDRAFT_354396 [Sodiomyces alkalinus F11]|uniref:Uncharacterized protein n=1 Tax=Sodiomyces alkalinus (strain CBS 110278 / VKM F-3762 / F11) TaxID=1314773 RepID=A0A3N2Q6H9_SODAK|nr:hypothetical protein SODALDRAFT_354396 [Sodiomyces alkalinus F11]ROT42268.1 hypothetical protein SODALDRAFT_354396 [Sodiomyces alkalinus F11]
MCCLGTQASCVESRKGTRRVFEKRAFVLDVASRVQSSRGRRLKPAELEEKEFGVEALDLNQNAIHEVTSDSEKGDVWDNSSGRHGEKVTKQMARKKEDDCKVWEELNDRRAGERLDGTTGIEPRVPANRDIRRIQNWDGTIFVSDRRDAVQSTDGSPTDSRKHHCFDDDQLQTSVLKPNIAPSFSSPGMEFLRGQLGSRPMDCLQALAWSRLSHRCCEGRNNHWLSCYSPSMNGSYVASHATTDNTDQGPPSSSKNNAIKEAGVWCLDWLPETQDSDGDNISSHPKHGIKHQPQSISSPDILVNIEQNN